MRKNGLSEVCFNDFTGNHPDQTKIKEVAWRAELFHQETEELKSTPWYANYRYQPLLCCL